MEKTVNKSRATWLFAVSIMVAGMVVIGGLTRLTRSGLSIVEWNVITGILPPIGQDAWEEEFAKYQQTPEYQLINSEMTLEGYKQIYFWEYLHRLLGRIVGLAFVLPLFYYLGTRKLAWKESFPYLLIGLGFAFQGWLGWYMVASGLVDRPSVSHFRLAAHLISAITLLALTFWVGLDNLLGKSSLKKMRTRASLFWITVGLVVTYLLQATYGAFVAGLKAGHVSNTWPLMAGRLVPPGLLTMFDSAFQNLVSNPVTVHFIHRWFAWVVFGLGAWLVFAARRRGTTAEIWKAIQILIWTIGIQIALGVSVVLFSVPISLASIHQTVALGIFVAALFVLHRLGETEQPA